LGPSQTEYLCVGFVLIGVLAVVLLSLYLMTEGVTGIVRRLYAMLLLLLSVLVVGIVIGMPIVLCAVAFYAGLFMFAIAAGVPFLFLITTVGAFSGAAVMSGALQGGEPRESRLVRLLTAHLAWIKRVARGKKGRLREEKSERWTRTIVVKARSEPE